MPYQMWLILTFGSVLIAGQGEAKSALDLTKIIDHNAIKTEEDYDAMVTEALFLKINWIIAEMTNLMQNTNKISTKLAMQDQMLSSILASKDSFKMEMFNAIQEHNTLLRQWLLENQNVISQNFKNANGSSKSRPARDPYDLNALLASHKWTVVLRRQNDSLTFDRNWNEYRNGFGPDSGNDGSFFIGLETLHTLTNAQPQQLLIVMEDFHNVKRYAYYDNFRVANESEKYQLMELGQYHGDAGDALRSHVSAKFSTPDQDNDIWPLNCADIFRSGWWFNKCYTSHLTALYVNPSSAGGISLENGIIWKTFGGRRNLLKFVEMSVAAKQSDNANE